MKIKTISRSEADYTRERSQDIYKVHRNIDPEIHPFEKAREYTRALNATKVERMFAKPFVGALSGHIDGVYCLAKHPTHLTTIVSGSADGEIRLWSLSSRETVWSTRGHEGFVRGLTCVPFSDNFISVGEDKIVKIWDRSEEEPLQTYIAKTSFTGVDHHRSQPLFATSSSQIDLWDHSRSQPTQTFNWGAETITSIKFNQTEQSVFASCGTDRTIVLYDIRTNTPLKKIIMAMRTNAIAWNPMEAFNFTTANEDHNCYTFDMRRLDSAINVMKDHVSAVLDLDYSPTGQEIVTGSYDKSIRIFNAQSGHSREIYHTKRMQKIFCVKFSMDARFVLSGSDDGNIRLWKANASEKLAPKTPREANAIKYQKAIKERYKHMPEIRRIDRQRQVPKAVKSARKTKHVMVQSQEKKEENLRKHSAPGAVPHVAERKKNILRVEK
ncbi:WD40-repeat-containing domain protein [Polychytrium aggregatum]|uniref:WD40-repeat-containing domain protein n=1 Tax=Polychytrium aggregatum TaxID=110093 RepID=UPI0022FDE493|nr:WD40-repeat-containing domain protein [Polychytrium aggregatum]KAI9207967.1 WD40-repeat-containing domain protein [Polychytrium aggregatum]